MTRKRTAMSTIHEILRLKKLGHNKSEAAKLLKLNRETIRKLWDASPEEYKEFGEAPSWAKEVDWKYLEQELKTVPRKILYEELKQFIALPSYQAFCQYLRNHKTITTPTHISLKQDRVPGKSIEVDYSGDSFDIINPATRQIHATELFVGSLSYSSYFYAEFSLSQKLEDFIRSHCNMFAYFGGVAQYIVPDNCKTAVKKTHRYDPILNSTYQDMCRYYQVVIDPADRQSPTHKPNVENAVKYIQSSFLQQIRNKTFSSLIELNRELHNWLKVANTNEIQGRGESRLFFFKREELRPLPRQPYQLFYFEKRKVHPDCHFQHQKNHYSVPYKYVGKEIDIKFNNKMVHAYYNGLRIATHSNLSGTYHWSTNESHYPDKKHIEFNYHISKGKEKAKGVGENTATLINRLFAKEKHPLKNLRKVQGILRLVNKYSKEAVEYACEQALDFDRLNYDNIKLFAKNFSNKPIYQPTPARQSEQIYLQGDEHEGSNGTIK